MPTDVMSWITVVANMGFPAIVAIWLLARHERILRDLEKAIDRLADAIEQIREELKEVKESVD